MKVARLALPLLVFSAVIAAACNKGDTPPADGGEPAGEAAPAVPVSFDPSTITESELALGDSIFHGLIGATSCQSCHGAGGQNGAAAPSLADDKWLHSDGSFEGIHKTIASGVMTPKEFSGVMPPFGGAPLDAAKHRAVAAYVYRLSHK
ncbi:MAG: c-type cytochrome [Gemmatimonadaceae bacterium]|nr:c-type cytochrome [Gemmatimonadaceae bacterium]